MVYATKPISSVLITNHEVLWQYVYFQGRSMRENVETNPQSSFEKRVSAISKFYSEFHNLTLLLLPVV